MRRARNRLDSPAKGLPQPNRYKGCADYRYPSKDMHDLHLIGQGPPRLFFAEMAKRRAAPAPDLDGFRKFDTRSARELITEKGRNRR